MLFSPAHRQPSSKIIKKPKSSHHTEPEKLGVTTAARLLPISVIAAPAVLLQSPEWPPACQGTATATLITVQLTLVQLTPSSKLLVAYTSVKGFLSH